jgi:sterol desaturase/sphingolipid hydroxylase (fatty acid hydroxylase superfamily)
MDLLSSHTIDSLKWGFLLGVFGEQSLRYVVPALIIAAILRFLPSLGSLRLQRVKPKTPEMWRDFGSSFIFAAITALVGIPIMLEYVRGGTMLYGSVEGHGFGRLIEWGYLPVSFVLLLVVHDAYFYWTHRLLHVGRTFRIAHSRHHLHRTPSVWTAFAFHPLEGLVQAGIYPLAVFMVPTHRAVFSLFVIFTGFYAAVLHCGHDLLLCSENGRFARWLYTTVDHDEHHRRGRCGYALYFGWWDTWMGTRVRSVPVPSQEVVERAA